MKIDDIYFIVKVKKPEISKEDFMKIVKEQKKKLKGFVSLNRCAGFVAKQMGINLRDYA